MKNKNQTLWLFVLGVLLGTFTIGVLVKNPSIFSKNLQSDEPVQNQITMSELLKIGRAIQVIETKYLTSVDRKKLLDGAISGMVSVLDDPHSQYLNEKDAESFTSSIQGTFFGIGAEVTMIDGRVTIQTPIKNTPASKAGLLAQDVIVGVNDESVEKLTLDQVVAKIRGPRGTKVRVKIARPGVQKVVEYVLVREKIEQVSARSKVIDKNIGYIELALFEMNSAVQFKNELDALESKGIQGLIIDLRNNPGGVLQVVTEICENFIPQGKAIYQIHERGMETVTYYSKGKATKPYPIAILINKGSASASELFAGAMKDNKLATIVGESSFGKGTVQTNFSELGDKSSLKISIAKWLTPLGTWIHHKGVEPNIKVDPLEVQKVFRITSKEPLKFDMVHEDVKTLQIILKHLGYSVDRKDGYFDRSTLDALKKFQTDKKIPSTGVLDKDSNAKLEKVLQESFKDPALDVQLKKALEVVEKKNEKN